MIRLPEIQIPEEASTQLQNWQREIDELAEYSIQVEVAKTQFSARNKKGNITFDSIKSALERMCSGSRRCCYCEDSGADEVEHIRPKDLFPEFVFVWDNYLYSCGLCNSPKNNRFAVFAHENDEEIDITRKRGSPILPPPSGDPLLINPRIENPLDYLELDLQDTFYFSSRYELSRKDRRRAEYTCELLRLNDRDYLLSARAEAYSSYRARLKEYISERERQKSQTTLTQYRDGIRRMGHPTVWKEMQRQHNLHTELHKLFEQAPEALEW